MSVLDEAVQPVRDVARPQLDRNWVRAAVRTIEADAARSADTHLHRLPLPAGCGIDIYLKDESGHPTGSLKHRLARSLVLYGLCNGWIGPTTTLVEASSGSTAVSEAYFARLLGLPFVAVIPRSTSQEKIALIEAYGGSCRYVDEPGAVYAEASRTARELGGHYLDQFTYAEQVTDWRGNNNIAQSIFEQMRHERHPEPAWLVVGAGTGGTSATLGRYVRYRGALTQVAVVDPEGSAFFESWTTGESVTSVGSRIEGIGRPRLEPSFVGSVIDRMLQVPDAASLAAMHWLRELTGLAAGPSTGTSVFGCLLLAAEMARAGETGSIVTLLCDRGDRYEGTYYDEAWVRAQGLRPELWRGRIDELLHALSP